MTPELRRWKEMYTEELSYLGDDFFELFGAKDAAEFISDRLYADPDIEISYAVIIDDRVAGCIHLTAGRGLYTQNACLLLWLAEEHRGHGYMTVMLGEFCRKAFENSGLLRITAMPPTDCTAARCVLNNCGFEMESTIKKAVIRNGVVTDLCCYALLRDEQ